MLHYTILDSLPNFHCHGVSTLNVFPVPHVLIRSSSQRKRRILLAWRCSLNVGGARPPRAQEISAMLGFLVTLLMRHIHVALQTLHSLHSLRSLHTLHLQNELRWEERRGEERTGQDRAHINIHRYDTPTIDDMIDTTSCTSVWHATHKCAHATQQHVTAMHFVTHTCT